VSAERAFRLPALALAAVLGLWACAGLPDRGSAAEGWVTGSLSLEFPDGFLGQPPRTIRSGILLQVRNVTTGKRFFRAVSDGRFSFRAAGELRLVRYEYSQSGQDFSCYLNDEIGIGFRLEPGQSLDLGRITLRYTRPAPSHRTTFARSNVAAGELTGEPGTFSGLLRLRHAYWRYERTVLR